METKNNFSIGLTITRVLVCFIIIKNMCFYLPLSEDYFGLTGIFPYEVYLQLMKSYGLDYLTFPFHIPLFTHLFIIGMIVLATCYMLAIGGRLTGLLLYLGIIILKVRNGFILDGSDNVIQVILPFLLLADNLKYFRYFKRKKNAFSNFLSKYSEIFAFALMVQVCFVYLFTGLAKHEGELWRNGTAVFYTMRVKDFMATDWNVLLTKNHYFVVFLTYFTVFWELSFPFLVWFKKTKYWIFLGGVMLHVGIWVFMRIDNFSWVMLSTYFVFIKDEEYRNFYNIIRSQKLKIFVDGWCPICLKFGQRVKQVDLFKFIHLEDVRTAELPNKEFKARALSSMASINQNDKIAFGFDTLFRILLRLPIFWVLIPFAFILKITGIGELLYTELALKRSIVPIHCRENCKI